MKRVTLAGNFGRQVALPRKLPNRDRRLPLWISWRAHKNLIEWIYTSVDLTNKSQCDWVMISRPPTHGSLSGILHDGVCAGRAGNIPYIPLYRGYRKKISANELPGWNEVLCIHGSLGGAFYGKRSRAVSSFFVLRIIQRALPTFVKKICISGFRLQLHRQRAILQRGLFSVPLGYPFHFTGRIPSTDESKSPNAHSEAWNVLRICVYCAMCEM